MTNFLVNWSNIWEQVKDFFVWGPRFKLVLLIMCGVFLLAIVGLTLKEVFAPRKIAVDDDSATEIDTLSMVDELADAMTEEKIAEMLANPAPVSTPANIPANVPEGYAVEYVDGKPVYYSYSYSFTAKLAQASEETKEYYNRIKNCILSYGAKPRMSWANESFYLGRNTYVKFGIRGKTLSTYLALNTEEFVDTKYIFENEGDVKKYEAVPMRVRVKSNRGAKWACELVAILFEKLGIAQKETEAQDFRPAYRTTEDLLADGLIKKVQTDSLPAFTVVDDDFTTDEERLDRMLAALDNNADALAAQIIADRDASPVVEVAKAVDNAADNQVEELLNVSPAMEEAAATETVAEEVAETVAPATEPEFEIETVDGKQIYWLYSYSFTAKLHQASNETKDYYNQIKNRILAYGAKSRMSWPNESFYIGRTTYVKFGIRGKTLSVYLALRPADYENTKYIYEDASDVKKYETVPMRLRVKSNRGAKWACELIDILFANLGRTLGELAPQDYRLPYETTKVLLDRGLVKKVQTDKLPNFSEMAAEEQPVAETPVQVEESAPVEEEVAETVAETVEPATEPEFEIETVEGKQIYWLYSYSFTAKLHQASDETKDYYNQIKNRILAYGAKSRMSWPNESFYIGRTTYVKFGIRGKTLSVYLALNPADYENTKYIYEDASDVKKYEGVPMRLRVKSNRGAKWACELIDILFANLGRALAEQPEANYRLPYETTKVLLDRGLVKKVQTDKLPNFSEMTAEEPVPVEEVAATEAVAPAEPITEPKFEIETVEGKQIYWLYSYSFTAKLHQASNETKDYYNQIKNRILAYGAKSRMSWPNESFYIGSTTYVKFGIRGKTLSVYLALNPADYENTKYIYEDASDVKKYEAVPMRLRVKSNRGAKWACELIDILFANLGRTLGELTPQDYRLPYETTKVLLDRGLVKKVQTDKLPNFAAMEKSVEEQPVAEAVERVEPVEETVTETTPVEAVAEATETVEPVAVEPVAEPPVVEAVEEVAVTEAEEIVEEPTEAPAMEEPITEEPVAVELKEEPEQESVAEESEEEPVAEENEQEPVAEENEEDLEQDSEDFVSTRRAMRLKRKNRGKR